MRFQLRRAEDLLRSPLDDATSDRKARAVLQVQIHFARSLSAFVDAPVQRIRECFPGWEIEESELTKQ